MKSHEELISMAFATYEKSTLDYGLSDTEMVEKLRGMNDAFLCWFIGVCEKNI